MKPILPTPNDSEDTEHTPAERAAAASQSTWVSVFVSLALTVTQIVAGVMVGVIQSIGCWMVFQSYPAEASEPAVGTAQASSGA